MASHQVLLTAHVTHVAPDSVIRIYANPTGLPRRLIATGHPNASGNPQCPRRPAPQHLIRRRVAAGLTYGSATTPRQYVLCGRALVPSCRVTTARVAAGLYHYTTACVLHHRGCPTVTAGVWPGRAGKTVALGLQVLAAGRWQTVFSNPFRLNSPSQVTALITYRNSTVVGHSYRLHVSYPGDAEMKPNVSGAGTTSASRGRNDLAAMRPPAAPTSVQTFCSGVSESQWATASRSLSGTTCRPSCNQGHGARTLALDPRVLQS